MKQQVIVDAFKKATGKTIKLVRVRNPERYDTFDGREEDWNEWMHGGDTIYYQKKRTLCYFLAIAFYHAVGQEKTEKILGYNYKVDAWCKYMCFAECDKDPKTCTEGDEEMVYSDEVFGEGAIPFVEKWLKKIDEEQPKVIKFFIREEPYGFLSNFERTGFWATPHGVYANDHTWLKPVWYPTNEHYYQAQKPIYQQDHDDIVSLSRATQAMELGRAYDHGRHLNKYCKREWEWIKLVVMLNGLRHKFKDETLRQKLLDTGNAILHEDNPDDQFWALGDGGGSSWLGKLLMVVREECRGWSCNNFGYMRCTDGDRQEPPETCPVKEICEEFTEYMWEMANKYE